MAEEITDEELIGEVLPKPWPGPSFESFPEPDGRRLSCLVVEGDEAAAVFRASNDKLDPYWDDHGTIWPVDAVVLVPGAQGCPPR